MVVSEYFVVQFKLDFISRLQTYIAVQHNVLYIYVYIGGHKCTHIKRMDDIPFNILHTLG